MKNFDLLTVTGEFWHYHAIGTGAIFTYSKRARQVIILCSASGTIIDVVNNKDYGSPQEFKEEASSIYVEMINNGDTSLELSFYENATLIGESMVEIDFDLIKN